MSGFQRLPHRLLGALFVLLIVAGLAVFNAGPANAHATVLSTSPAHGSEIEEAVSELKVTFSEPVTLGGLSKSSVLRDSTGKEVETPPAELDASGTVLSVKVPADLAKDVYIFSWRAISADTHPVGGSIQFAYGVPLGAVDTTAAPPEPAAELTLAVGIAKGAVYLGLVLAFGLVPTALILRCAGSRKLRRLLLAGLLLTAVASIIQLAMQFWWIDSASPETADDPRAFLTTPYAAAVWLRLGILIVAGTVIGRARRMDHGLRAGFYLLLGAAAIATVVFNGHGGGGSRWLLVSLFIHAVAATVWIGGLVVLSGMLVFARTRPGSKQQFSLWLLLAACCVTLLVVSGILQSVEAVGFPTALIDTGYGRILVLKVLLVAAAIGLGVWGFVSLRRVSGAAAARAATLVRSVRWEVGLGVVIVVISGVVSSITPAREEWSPAVAESTSIGPYEVTVELTPARVGPQTMRVRVLPPHRDTPRPEEIELQLRQPGTAADSVDSVRVDFNYRIPEPYNPQAPAATSFVSSAFSVPAAGDWEASITLVVDRMEQYSEAIKYKVY